MQKKYSFTYVTFIILATVCLTAAQASAVTPQIAAGDYHNVALAADGTVWTWGKNLSGQLCDSTRPSPDANPRPIPGLTDVVHISAGSDYTLAVKGDGSVWACGANNSGQLGRGFTSDYEPNIAMVIDSLGTGNLTGIKSVSAGNNHSLAISNDGKVWGWGSNYGKLGVDEPVRTRCGGEPICTKPVQADNITNAVAVAAGNYHSIALVDTNGDGEGEVWTWGSNNTKGQLGRTGNEFIPAKISDNKGSLLTDITSIAAGWEHSLAVTSIGNLYGWGTNEEYQVLISDNLPSWAAGWEITTKQLAPILIPPQAPDPNVFNQYNLFPPLLKDIIAVSTSQSHSMVITSNGGTLNTVIGWGRNNPVTYKFCEDPLPCIPKILVDSRGALGVGNDYDYAVSPLSPSWSYNNLPPPAPLWNTDLVDIVAIATGRRHSIALRADDSVYASGINDQHQLGTTSPLFDGYTNIPAPVELTNMVCDTSGVDFNFNVTTPPIDCDFDGDGIPYSDDNCPSLANDQTDANGNGIGDACDGPCSTAGGDSDGDTICDDNDNCPSTPNYLQTNTDSDSLGNACDADDDGDTVLDIEDNCPLNQNSDQTDSDGDDIGDVCDIDADGDGFSNFEDLCPFIADSTTPQLDSDSDGIGNACDSCPDDVLDDIDKDGICSGSGFKAPMTGDADNCPNEPNSDQSDSDADLVGDDCDVCPNELINDEDGDGLCAGKDYLTPKDGDEDNCPTFANVNQDDLDNDDIGDACDKDKDNDGAENGLDGIDILDADGRVIGYTDYSTDPKLCSDSDKDGCNDCTNQVDGLGPDSDYNPNNDGLDTDSDGKCDAGDLDDDNDGVVDDNDDDSIKFNVCKDSDGDGCDDCAITGDDKSGGNTLNDGQDIDGDGICYASDPDDDNDGVLDKPGGSDSDSSNPEVCKDDDGDGCDDCAITKADGSGGDINNDGLDTDGDGICDAGDVCIGNDTSGDSDSDGVCDDVDKCPGSPDSDDADGDGAPDDCDVCTGDDATGDADNDGICNDQETDDDNDGIPDTSDLDPLDEFSCADADNDSCDDCTVTGPDGSGGSTTNDGPDYDKNGLCDAGETDDDKDGVDDIDDSDPFNRFDCSDADSDNCEDCYSGAFAPNNDGVDSDSDGICDAGDAYPDDPYLVDPGITSVVIPPASNIDTSATRPKINVQFPFEISVNSASAASAWLVLNDQPIEMDCGDTPNFSDPSEVKCTAVIKLGPAPAYNYHYEVWDSADRSGSVLASSLKIPGPTISLLNGPNMLGLPKDVSGSTKGFLNNLGVSKAFSWKSTGLHGNDDNGYFTAQDDTHIQTPGKGYFIISEATEQTLPASLLADPEIISITTPIVTIDLEPGWNIISNPYPAPILLSSLMIQKDNETALTWYDATSIRWVSNGIYYFKGKDWGSQYAYESAGGSPDATLTPWVGYWIYVKINNGANYKLIYTKPLVPGE